MRKILVTGGRYFVDRYGLYEVLDTVCEGKPVFIIEGGSNGADMLAAQWAKEKGYPCAEVLANWETYEDDAGPIQNRWMLELKPDLVVAFSGEDQNMIEQAEELGIPILRVE